jgi:hypothetical protein
MKTSLLTSAVLCGLVTTRSLLARRVAGMQRPIGGLVGWFVAGVVTVPTSLIGYFASRHVLPELWYAVLTHNTFPLGTWEASPQAAAVSSGLPPR